jgi:hypothetical protein
MKTHRKKLVKATELNVPFPRSVKVEGGMKLVVSIACLVSPAIILGINMAESNAYSDGGGSLSGVGILIYHHSLKPSTYNMLKNYSPEHQALF